LITIKGYDGAGDAAGFLHDDCRLVASVDVEWTKNYRIRDGNVPFCWSVVWLQVPRCRSGQLPSTFRFTSCYVSGSEETQDLIAAADSQIASMLRHADLIIGHQVSSDLAVLRNASGRRLAAVEELRDRWHSRKDRSTVPSVVDSRYDAGGILQGTSRRLVDVCTELGLDVTQPELSGMSMTALHRRWLDVGDVAARERISVLNLRHSLSAAYVALRSQGLGSWTGRLNVNQILDSQLAGLFGWLSSPAFRRLL
jgi:hypothetical protein